MTTTETLEATLASMLADKASMDDVIADAFANAKPLESQFKQEYHYLRERIAAAKYAVWERKTFPTATPQED